MAIQTLTFNLGIVQKAFPMTFLWLSNDFSKGAEHLLVDFPTYCALGKSSLPTAFGAEENFILKRKLLKLILHLKSDSTLGKLPIIIGAVSPFYVNLKKISLTLLSMPTRWVNTVAPWFGLSTDRNSTFFRLLEYPRKNARKDWYPTQNDLW